MYADTTNTIIPEDAERASNAYLMSLVVFMGGLPLPILNLLATLIFAFAYRKASYFVRWHCMQTLVSQLFIFCFNTVVFWWTVTYVFEKKPFTEAYYWYLAFVILLNIAEIAMTIYMAIEVRKHKHIVWKTTRGLISSFIKP